MMDRKNFIGFSRGFSLSTVYCLLSTVITLLFALSSPLVAEAADKLVVKDALGTSDVFKVDDSGTVTSNKGILGEYATPAKSTRVLNVIGNAGGMRLWRVNLVNPPFMEFIYSKLSDPDTVLSYWDINAGTVYDPIRFFIRDRGAGDLIRLSIDNNGNIGLGMHKTPPSYPLEMASGAHVTAGGVWTNASSREYKENIRELTGEEALLVFNKLNPVAFNYKVDKDEKHVGFVAEDVPELVSSKDRKGLSPMDIVAVLTRVVQEQQKRILELSEKINKLERN